MASILEAREGDAGKASPKGRQHGENLRGAGSGCAHLTGCH
jgi:hypothetical protein